MTWLMGTVEVEAEFDEFEVPVAELAPEELVDGVGGFVEAVVGEGVGDAVGDRAEAGEDPAGFEGRGLGELERDGVVAGERDLVAGFAAAVDVHLQEAGGVPDLVGEGAIAFGAGFVEGDVGAGRGLRGERETDGVGAVFRHDLDGVDHVALGLGHLLAVGVADQGVDVDVTEGHRVGECALAAVGVGDVQHEVAAEHDHAGDPEEEDVEAGDQELRGVEGGEVGSEGVGSVPAEDGEGEEAGGEPGVEDVGFLREVGARALGAGGGSFAGDVDLAAGAAVPGGDAMAPPELAGDAPVVDVGHPLVVGLGVHLGGELDGPCRVGGAADGGDGVGGDGVAAGVGLLVDGEEPLHGEARLNHGAGALRDGKGERVVLDGDEQAGGFEVGDDALAGFEAVEAVIGRAVEMDAGLRVHDGGRGKVVALADGEVVGVVRGRDFDGAGAELGLGPVVGEDGDGAIWISSRGAERKLEEFADEGGVALVGGVHGHGHVGEHGLGAGGGDDDGAGAVGERVADVVEMAGALFGFDFEVGDGGAEDGIPVDDVGAAVDEALLPEADEGFLDRDAEAVVHGEVLAGPVDARAEATHLVGDGRAVLLLPGPDAFGEGLAGEVGCGDLPSAASWRSTIIWVAMPAWSVPGTQTAVSPDMRCQRVRMSISVWLSMWPMCRRPVTLGGGSSWTKGGWDAPSQVSEARPGAPDSVGVEGFGVGTEKMFSSTQNLDHFSSISEGSYALGSS